MQELPVSSVLALASIARGTKSYQDAVELVEQIKEAQRQHRPHTNTFFSALRLLGPAYLLVPYLGGQIDESVTLSEADFRYTLGFIEVVCKRWFHGMPLIADESDFDLSSRIVLHELPVDLDPVWRFALSRMLDLNAHVALFKLFAPYDN